MKKLFSLLLCLALLTALPCSAQETEDLVAPLIDQADLLTPEEETALTERAIAIYDEFGIYTAIITVDSIGGISSTAFADNYYDRYYYPKHPDGVLLLISMEHRDWAISTCGKAIDLLTDYELDQVFFNMSDELSENQFYDAFQAYLNILPQYMKVAPRTEPGISALLRIVPIALLIGAAVGGITILIMRSQMNTAKPQASAGNYILHDRCRIKRHQDIFLYSRVTRTRKPENNGGGSSHRSSGGVRHGGRSGRF